jgi:large subunit ribosomal protein L30
MVKIAAMRIKGQFAVAEGFKSTFEMLGIARKNSCVILEDTPNNMGMIKKVKDFIAYGEISKEVLDKLMKKKEPISKTESQMVFNLPNPIGGFKHIKKGYNEGGDLGYRGKEINALLERIIENIN